MASTVRDRRPTDRRGQDRQSGRGRRLRHDAKRQPQPVKSAHIITEAIEVGVPAAEAFELWTDYEKWSQMFKNESARPRRGRGRSRGGAPEVAVRSKVGPSERRWTAVVTGTEPGHRINWRSRGPLQALGTTSFHGLDDRLTRVMVEVEYHPRGLLETVGNFFRMPRRRVRRDLRLFKNHAELQGLDGKGGE